MAVTKIPYKDFEEYIPGAGYPYGPAFYNERNPGRFDDEFPSPFGEDLFDRVKANPKRGSSADKKDAFQNLLNNATGQQIAQAPSQQALDADGKPIPGTSTGLPTFGGAIPGTMVGNMLGVLKGGVPYVPPLQGVLKGGVPVVPQLYGPILIPRR